MERLYIEFSAEAAQDDEVLRGVVLDYSDTGVQRDWSGNKQYYRVQAGGIEMADSVLLNMHHDRHQAVAGSLSPYLKFDNGKDKLSLELRYPDTNFGRQAREGVKTGIFTGLSAELEHVATRIEGKVTHIQKAVLDGVALVGRPAFGKSRFFDDGAQRSSQPLCFAAPIGIAYDFADVLTGLMRWGTIGVISAAEKRAILFEEGSLAIPSYVAFTLGNSYDGIVASTENGNLEVERTGDGIAWKLTGIAATTPGRDLRGLIRDQLIRGFTFGLQRQESEFSMVSIDGVDYELETIKRATLCEIRSNSTMMGGSGDVQAGRGIRRRRRRRRR